MDIIISAFLFGLALIALQTEVTPLWLDWPFVALCICLALARYTLSNEKWCRDLRVRLAAERSAQPYRALMLPLLRRVTRWRRPPLAGPDTRWLDFHARDAKAATHTAYAWFGWTLLDFALLWAVLYPLLLLLLQWVVMGEGRLGTFAVLPGWQSLIEPVGTLVALTLILILPRLAPWELTNRQVVIRISADWLPILVYTSAVALAVASAVASASAPASAVAFAFAVAFTATAAVAVTVAGTVALSVAAALAVAIAVAFAGAGTVADAFAFAFAGAVASTSAGVVAFAGAGAGAFAVAFAVARAVAVATARLVRSGRARLAYGLMVTIYVLLTLSIPAFLSFERMGDQVRGVYLFLGLFPLLNGVFDFLSYGVTLGLWRAGLRRGGIAPWVLGFADIVAALLLFTALGAALILSVAVMNRLAGVDILPLEPIFTDLRSKPVTDQPWLASAQAQYMWLYAMLFSTLVPTLIHAGLSCLSLAQWAPAGLRRRYVGWIDRRDESPWAEIGVTVGLGLTWFMSFMLPLVGLGGLLWLVQGAAPLVGETYLQVFELLARWLGQIDSIGPGYIPQGWGSPIEV